jgi:hypothetical protein
MWTQPKTIDASCIESKAIGAVPRWQREGALATSSRVLPSAERLVGTAQNADSERLRPLEPPLQGVAERVGTVEPRQPLTKACSPFKVPAADASPASLFARYLHLGRHEGFYSDVKSMPARVTGYAGHAHWFPATRTSTCAAQSAVTRTAV